MKQVLLTSAAILMGVSTAAFAQTAPDQNSGATNPPAATMSPPAGMAPARPVVRPVDRDAAAVPAEGRSSASMPAERRGTMSTSPGTPMGTDGMFTSIPAGEQMSSKVVGLDVYNAANKNIGKIKDVAFDQNGVKAYIVAVGGFMGMGDHYVAVNPSALNINFDADARKWRAAMNTDIDQLKAAPEYKYSSND
jgi:sporulation protein YlmC with PRC-barrel domain